MGLSSISPQMAELMYADLGKEIVPPKQKVGIAGKFMELMPIPGFRGALGFAGALMRGEDAFRAGIDGLTAAYPKAGIAAKTVILPDSMTAAGTLDEARARGLYP